MERPTVREWLELFAAGKIPNAPHLRLTLAEAKELLVLIDDDDFDDEDDDDDVFFDDEKPRS